MLSVSPLSSTPDAPPLKMTKLVLKITLTTVLVTALSFPIIIRRGTDKNLILTFQIYYMESISKITVLTSFREETLLGSL